MEGDIVLALTLIAVVSGFLWLASKIKPDKYVCPYCLRVLEGYKPRQEIFDEHFCIQEKESFSRTPTENIESFKVVSSYNKQDFEQRVMNLINRGYIPRGDLKTATEGGGSLLGFSEEVIYSQIFCRYI